MDCETQTCAHSVSFITMGCAKNEVDTDHMRARLSAAGYLIADDPERADVVIVNTCSFIQSATEESIDAVLEVAGYETVARGAAKLVVAGCMPSRYGDELRGELPEASEFVTCAQEDDIVARIDALFGVERTEQAAYGIVVDPERTDRVSAYVKISDGCDRFCAYCKIPFIRGRYHSFTLAQIRAEVERVVSEGAREVVLIAQDTGRWGSDLPESSTLAGLMDALATEWPDTWFRVLYIQPEGVTPELVEVVASHDNICSYFDIPFQHANARILKDMNRTGSAAEHLELVDAIRKRIPDATLRTTLIAGFPGEADEDFEELCAFVEEADLDYVGVFAYSQEEGTRASRLDGQVDEDEKASRAQTLRDLADAVSAPRIASRIDTVCKVLVCGREEDGQLFGRAMCQAPDVDGVTYVNAGEVGQIVEVRIEDTLLYEMEGSVL